MIRDTAGQHVGVQGVSATTGAAFTGTVTVYVTGDGGTQAIGSVGSGVCAHEGNGAHSYAPAQAETDYAHVMYTFVGTGMVPQTVQIYPILLAGDVSASLAEILARLPSGLSGGLMVCDIRSIDGSAPAAAQIANSLPGGTGLPVDVRTWNGMSVNNLISGRVDAIASVVGFNAITAGSISEGALTPAKLSADFFHGVLHVLSSVATVSGSIGELLVDALARLQHASGAIAFGTVDSGAALDENYADAVDGVVVVTVVPIKTIDPAGAVTDPDQLRGKVINFSASTPTSALKSQSARIRGNDSTNLHVTPLTTLPAEDDIFSIT